MAEIVSIRRQAGRFMPWKNGSGWTREIAVHPPGAGIDGFLWRVSIAEIGDPGSFSQFTDVDRQWLLLSGAGVILELPGECRRLSTPYQTICFAGEVPVLCTPINGYSQALNVMTRRSGAVAELGIIHGAASVVDAGGQRIFFVAEGEYRCCGKEGMLFDLHEGDAVLVTDGEVAFTGQGGSNNVLIEVTFRVC